jgi:hypothetical protein
MARLEPLRSGAPLISSEELARVDGDWIKWRAEWVRRKKIFNECVQAGYRVSVDVLSFLCASSGICLALSARVSLTLASCIVQRR